MPHDLFMSDMRISVLVLQGLDHDSLAAATIKVSELIPTIKCAGRAFHQVLGLRKNDTVQIYLPNTTAYFFPVFGTALCQGVVSVADPGLKVNGKDKLKATSEYLLSHIIYSCLG